MLLSQASAWAAADVGDCAGYKSPFRFDYNASADNACAYGACHMRCCGQYA
ncbi:hypothetical protein UC8_57470 [Roseimaritima ulvae]|uniref:Uncharacterized protein n=1 Tax=Roseimaritima ulvae TaxID=980254 RepID=A0A5B9QXB0_9BACT|nr:hypothetical protein UC8_57470 [Roseimaritima ulvae]